MLTAIVVVPTPPFGLKQTTVRRAFARMIPSFAATGPRSFERWNRSSSASTRASSSRGSNGLAMTSSAPASRKAMRSSTSSDCPMHRTGIDAIVGVFRTSRQKSVADRAPVTTSRMMSWLSGAATNASSELAVEVTV